MTHAQGAARSGRDRGAPDRRALWALAALLALAAAQRLWNAWGVPPLTGYDSPAHAGYMLTLLREGSLPHPYDGWSTFHPPLYYLLGAGVWAALDPLGPKAVVAGLRAIGALSFLATGGAAYAVARGLGAAGPAALAAAALVLFAPVSQLAAAMVGNEALAAALVSVAIWACVRLQDEPDSIRAAAWAGAAAGLALATKYTAVLAVAACAVPFATAALRSRAVQAPLLRAAAVCFGLIAVLAGPIYVRNLVLTGSPVPVTRDREPMKSMEASMVLRERQLSDYLWVPPEALRRPSLYHEPGKEGSFTNRNAAMMSVWGLVHAGVWYDPFGHRTSVREHRDENWIAPALAWLGLGPTLAVLLGFALSTLDVVRGRQLRELPLVVVTWLGLGMFVTITVNAPSPAAVKAAYLLGLAVPAGAFFARGLTWPPRAIGIALAAVSAAALLLAAVVFTNDLLFSPQPMGLRVWQRLALMLPDSHIYEAIQRLAIAWYR